MPRIIQVAQPIYIGAIGEYACRSLPEILQKTELFKPIRSQGTPDRKPRATRKVAESATKITREEAQRLESIYGVDLTALQVGSVIRKAV